VLGNGVAEGTKPETLLEERLETGPCPFYRAGATVDDLLDCGDRPSDPTSLSSSTRASTRPQARPNASNKERSATVGSMAQSPSRADEVPSTTSQALSSRGFVQLAGPGRAAAEGPICLGPKVPPACGTGPSGAQFSNKSETAATPSRSEGEVCTHRRRRVPEEQGPTAHTKVRTAPAAVG